MAFPYLPQRHDTWTGGEHYWIRWGDGQHEVRMELPDIYDDNQTVFTGTYEACIEYLDNLIIENAEYDLNL